MVGKFFSKQQVFLTWEQYKVFHENFPGSRSRHDLHQLILFRRDHFLVLAYVTQPGKNWTYPIALLWLVLDLELNFITIIKLVLAIVWSGCALLSSSFSLFISAPCK